MGARMCRQMVLHGYTSCMATCMSFISLVKMILLPSRQLYPKLATSDKLQQQQLHSTQYSAHQYTDVMEQGNVCS